MNVVIIGGGNIGMCLLGDISRNPSYDVTICASRPDDFIAPIEVDDDENGISYKSGMFCATNDVEPAVSKADVILCTLPAFLRKDFISRVENIVKPGAYLGFVPAYGGAEYCCGRLLERGVVVFGLQKVPYIARTKARGRVAGVLSRKKTLLVGGLPRSMTKECSSLLEQMLNVKCEPLPNYLSAALLPGNPLLHTCGSYVYLRDYVPGTTYGHQIFYWREWTDECSRMLFRMSAEMKSVCSSLPLDLSEVKGIPEYYEVSTPEEFTCKVHGIPSFHNLTLPMIQLSDNSYIPNLKSRFFTEDFPFGVAMLKGLAKLTGTATPTIDILLDWYSKVGGGEYFCADGSCGRDLSCTTVPQVFGLDTTAKLLSFYE